MPIHTLRWGKADVGGEAHEGPRARRFSTQATRVEPPTRLRHVACLAGSSARVRRRRARTVHAGPGGSARACTAGDRGVAPGAAARTRGSLARGRGTRGDRTGPGDPSRAHRRTVAPRAQRRRAGHLEQARITQLASSYATLSELTHAIVPASREQEVAAPSLPVRGRLGRLLDGLRGDDRRDHRGRGARRLLRRHARQSRGHPRLGVRRHPVRTRSHRHGHRREPPVLVSGVHGGPRDAAVARRDRCPEGPPGARRRRCRSVATSRRSAPCRI